MGENRPRHRIVLGLGFLVLVLVAAGVGWWSAHRQSAPAPPPVAEATARKAAGPGMPPDELKRLLSVGNGLKSVKPGMRRAEVESLLGRPAGEDIGPVDPTDNRFRTRYPAILAEPLPFAPGVKGYCEAVLEYDATKPGHPLVRVSAAGKQPPPGLELATPM